MHGILIIMKIRLIDVPMDFGASRRGVNIGPTALRLAGLKDSLTALGHEMIEEEVSHIIPIAERSQVGDPSKRYWDIIGKVCSELSGRVQESLNAGDFPLIMGGDHSLAIGSIGGIAKWCQEKNLRLGVVWVDAHADFNTPQTSPSGNIHGMPVAAASGRCPDDLSIGMPYIRPENIYQIGLREVDSREKLNLREARVNCYTMADIDRRGIADVMDEVLFSLEKTTDFIHVSFDADGLDPEYAPGVGTAVKGGLTYREAFYIMEALCESDMVKSAEIVEVNPLLDVRNLTAQACVRLLGSLLGDSIL